MTCPIYAQFLGKFLDVFILGAQDGLTFINPTLVPAGRQWIWPSWDAAADDPDLVDQGIRESRPGDWTDALQDDVGAVLEAGARRLAKHPDAAAQALLDRALAMLGHTASDDMPHHRNQDDWWPLADGDSPDDISHMPHSGPCVVIERPEPPAGRDDMPHGQAGAEQAE